MDARREIVPAGSARLEGLRRDLLEIVRTLLADSTVELADNFSNSAGDSFLAVELSPGTIGDIAKAALVLV